MTFHFTAIVIICSDFGAQENKICHCFHFSPSICHEVMGSDAMILVFWMLSFKPTFSLSSFTFIKRLFNSSLSATRVVSSAYLRLLIFRPAILIPAVLHPARLFTWCTLHISEISRVIIYSFVFSNFEPVCCYMSGSYCWFLSCIQISQEKGKVVWYSHLFKIFYSCDPQNQQA